MFEDRADNQCIFPLHWKKILQYTKHRYEDNYVKSLKESKLLFEEYKRNHYIKSKTLKELLLLSNCTSVLFYARLYQEQYGLGERPSQIIKEKQNASWMFERDYCFVNIRATAIDTADTGNMIDAVKLLPGLRVSGIHIAPFFACDYGIIYCQNSFYQINKEIVHKELFDAGVNAIEQMKFYIDCCHLLDMAVGFDMTPHTSWKSPLRLDHPECYRWVRLNEDRTSLYEDMSIDEQYKDSFQKICQKNILSIANELKVEYKIEKFDVSEYSQEAERIAQIGNQKLREKGYFSVPPQTWNGVGVPSYKKYSYGADMPIWDYRDSKGQDQGQHAIWLHSCFYLHKGMRANRMPDVIGQHKNAEKVIFNEDTRQFLISYISEIVEQYQFDFVRLDYVDHIFNVQETKDGQLPVSETLTPDELKNMIDSLRQKWPGLGFQADHLGKDGVKFGKAGFNIITGEEVGRQFNIENERDIFDYLMDSEKIGNNQCRPNWAIDTHDMAHPLFFGKELALREGRVGMLARFFVSRFGNVGPYRRPKYEVIGNQVLASGIHRANNRPESLAWTEDLVVFNGYHQIEDLYDALKDELKDCRIVSYEIGLKNVVFTLEYLHRNAFFIGIVPIPIVNGKNCNDCLESEKSFVLRNLGGRKMECFVSTTAKQLDFTNRCLKEDFIQIDGGESGQNMKIELKESGFLLIRLTEQEGYEENGK